MTDMPHTKGEQQHVAELLRSFDAPAPEALRRRVESLVAAHQHQSAPRFPGLRLRRLSPLGLAGAGALTAAVVAIVIAIGLGSRNGPAFSFSQAAASTLRAATLPAPPESQAHRTQLAIAVDGVPFPYWSERFGWHSTGARADRIDGRQVTTVFYADSSGRRIGYAILAGTHLPRVDGGTLAWRGSVAYRLLTQNGAGAVVWLRDGHLCVISGHHVSSALLLKLASWDERDANAT